MIKRKLDNIIKVLFSKSFTDAYNVKETITITPDNYLEYLYEWSQPWHILLYRNLVKN